MARNCTGRGKDSSVCSKIVNMLPWGWGGGGLSSGWLCSEMSGNEIRLKLVQKTRIYKEICMQFE